AGRRTRCPRHSRSRSERRLVHYSTAPGPSQDRPTPHRNRPYSPPCPSRRHHQEGPRQNLRAAGRRRHCRRADRCRQRHRSCRRHRCQRQYPCPSPPSIAPHTTTSASAHEHSTHPANPKPVIAVLLGKRDGEGRGVTRLVHDLVTQAGGSISAEHGIGQSKLGELTRLGDPARLGAMRAIKQALDPKGIIKPDKLVPPFGPTQESASTELREALREHSD